MELKAQKPPNTMRKGIWLRVKSCVTWKANCTSEPIKKEATVAEHKAEISNGTAVVMVMSNISTSTVNSTPAKGARKIPAMAPAAPQPNSSFTPRLLTWKKRPTLEPMAEPVEAMGASSPTLPPNATVRVEATSEVYMLPGGRRPSLREMASSTLGMPWPI